jgi:hypothetical protein
MASYEKEVEQLVTTFEKLGIPKTQEGISDRRLLIKMKRRKQDWVTKMSQNI